MMTAIVTPAPVIRETQLQTRSRMNFELGFFVFPLVMLCAVRSLETGSCSRAPDFSTSDSELRQVETVYWSWNWSYTTLHPSSL